MFLPVHTSSKHLSKPTSEENEWNWYFDHHPKYTRLQENATEFLNKYNELIPRQQVRLAAECGKLLRKRLGLEARGYCSEGKGNCLGHGDILAFIVRYGRGGRDRHRQLKGGLPPTARSRLYSAPSLLFYLGLINSCFCFEVDKQGL